jgi:DNA repair protein RadC
MKTRTSAFAEMPLPLFGDPDEAQPVALGADRLPSCITDHRKRLRARFI